MGKKKFIHLTKHAKDRMNERVWYLVMQDFALKAFENGKRLSQEEYNKIIIRKDTNKFKRRCFSRDFIKYFDHLWIFEGSGEDEKFIYYKLVTVRPL